MRCECGGELRECRYGATKYVGPANLPIMDAPMQPEWLVDIPGEPHWHHVTRGCNEPRPAIEYEPDEHITEIFRQTFGGNYS